MGTLTVWKVIKYSDQIPYHPYRHMIQFPTNGLVSLLAGVGFLQWVYFNKGDNITRVKEPNTAIL